MIKVVNWMIPFVGYKMMAVWPFLFIRDDLWVEPTRTDYRHEEIHGMQQVEMLVVGMVIASVLMIWGCGWWSLLALPVFFYWYIIEWIVRLVLTGSNKKAYRGISFEQEAYGHEEEVFYTDVRRHFAWIRYVFKK